MRTSLHLIQLQKRSKVFLTAGIFVLSFLGLQAQVKLTPTGAWNVRSTISGRYDVHLAGASALMPSTDGSATCQGATEKNNDEQNRPYADVDGDGSTFQSSSSTINPDIICGEIVHAYLYWGGGFASGGPTEAQARTCKIKHESGGYTNITADYYYTQMWDGTTQITRDAEPYVCFKDVTSLFAGLTGGTFTVGNIYTSTGSPTGGQLGAWTLVLVYESEIFTQKTIRFWDNMVLGGTSGVNPTTNSLTGLSVPPTGTIEAFLGMLSMDGDADKTHTVTVRSNGTGGGTWLPVDNGFPQFMASAIAEDGVHVPKNINCNNTLGWDAQHISLPSGTIKNGTTTVDFQYSTNDEVTYLFASYIGVELSEPRLEITKESSKNSVIFNEVYQYTVSLNNIGGVATQAGFSTVLDTIDLPVTWQGVISYVLENNVTHATSNPPGIAVATQLLADGRTKVTWTNIPSIASNFTLHITYSVRVRPNTAVDFWRLECMKIVRNIAYANYRQGAGFPTREGWSNQEFCGEGDYVEVLVNEDFSQFAVQYEAIMNLGVAGVGQNKLTNSRSLINSHLASIGSSLTDVNFLYYKDIAMTIPLPAGEVFTAAPTNQYVYAKRIGIPPICSETFILRFILANCVNPVSRTITKKDVTCNGGSNGEVYIQVVTPIEGPMRFKFLSGTIVAKAAINAGNTLESIGNTPPTAGSTYNYTFSGYPAGTYTVASIDGRDCYFFNTITLVEPAPIVVTLAGTPGCIGDAIDFTVSAVGGPANLAGTQSKYTWQWFRSTDGVTWVEEPSQIEPDKYKVVSGQAQVRMRVVGYSTVAACTDVVCVAEDDLTVNNVVCCPTPTIAAIVAPAALCVGGSLNPTAPVVTVNGANILSQSWQLETGVGTGVYADRAMPYVVALADNGKRIRYRVTTDCRVVYSNVVAITVNPVPAITPMTAAVCSAIGFTSTPVNGANGVVPAGTTYTWAAPVVTGGLTGGAANAVPAGSVTGTLTNPTFVAQTATYAVTATAGTCTSNYTLTVTIRPNPAIVLNVPGANVCPSSVSALTTTLTATTGAYVYAWTNATASGAGTANYTAPASCANNTVLVTVQVTDFYGCIASNAKNITSSLADFAVPAAGSSTVACPAAAAVVPANPSVNDACGNAITPTGPVISAAVVCEGPRTYTWTYTDCKGNTHPWYIPIR